MINHKGGGDELQTFNVVEVNPDDKSVGQQFGNFDFLLYNDIDFKHPDVREEMKRWISWFIKETGVDGFRLDAIKHIIDWYIKEFIEHVRGEFGDQYYIVGEYS